MDGSTKQFGATQSVYHRFLQPAYERMIIQHVYRNKINLKSGALGELLQKRPKTTGYLGKKYGESAYPTASTYWNPGASSQWLWPTSLPPSAQSERARSTPYAHNTDECNLRTSSRANTFSATTRVREVPISGVYKKEIQEFRSRTPSARGVRAAALTNRSRVASQCASIVPTSACTRTCRGSEQSARLLREHEQLELTRERKRMTQVSSHRVDRMYYMNGSPSKIHPRYGVSDEELERIRSIAISRGIKIPVVPYATAGPWAQKRSSTVSGPHSTPRCPDDDDFGSDLHGSQRTVIPTADDASVPGDLVSNDGTEKSCSAITKEDRATSDNEEDDLTGFDMLTPRISPPAPPPEKHLETLSVRSDTALVSEKRRSVTFITETPDDADDNASFAQS